VKRRHIVFVYGTLKRGHFNYDRLLKGQSDFLGEAETVDRLCMVDLGYFPGVLSVPATSTIKGELFGVSDKVIESLDHLEGHPTFYCRTPIKVETEIGSVITAEIYILQRTGSRTARVITDGHWHVKTVPLPEARSDTQARQ
jgi:gamma-glutamylaminecyclotransferase